MSTLWSGRSYSNSYSGQEIFSSQTGPVWLWCLLSFLFKVQRCSFPKIKPPRGKVDPSPLSNAWAKSEHGYMSTSARRLLLVDNDRQLFVFTFFALVWRRHWTYFLSFPRQVSYIDLFIAHCSSSCEIENTIFWRLSFRHSTVRLSFKIPQNWKSVEQVQV